MLPLPKNDKEARRFVYRRRALLPDLLKLMVADRAAARGPLSSPKSRESYRLALSRVLEILAESPPRKPLLDGLEVMKLLNLKPGPQVGEAVRFVQEAEAVGDVSEQSGKRRLHSGVTRRYRAGWIRVCWLKAAPSNRSP